MIAKDNASKDIRKVGDAAEDTGKRGGVAFKAMTAAATALAAAAGKFAFDAVKSASNAEQAFGGVESVFGDAAGKVEKYAARSAKALGLSGQDYATLAATVGSQLQRMGQSQDESAVSTDKLVTLGADLAATFGGSVSDAVSAVGSLLRGERDPIERYGVGINEAAIKSELAAKGLDGLTGAALEQAKAQATLELLMKQTTNAQGAAAREAGTLQGQTMRLTAGYTDLSAQLGAKLLPFVLQAIEKFTVFAKWVDRNRQVVIPLTAAIGGLTVAVLAINAAVKVGTAITAAASVARRFFTTTTIAATGAERASTVSTIAHRVATVASTVAMGIARAATVAYTVAQRALNLALRANPIGLVITALAGLAVGVKVAYDRSSTFRGIVDKLWASLKEAGAQLGRFLSKLKDFQLPGWVRTLGDVVGKLGGGFKAGFNALKDGVGDGPGRPVGGGGPALARVQKLIAGTGARITSTYRTPARNAAVGGSPRSYHLDRLNPAVDVVGPTAVLNRLARQLAALPGTRELLWRTKGHFDHLHYAHSGGPVLPSWPTFPGLKSDERPAVLQTGEQVISRGDSGDIVQRLDALVDSNERLLRAVMRLPRESRHILRGMA